MFLNSVFLLQQYCCIDQPLNILHSVKMQYNIHILHIEIQHNNLEM